MLGNASERVKHADGGNTCCTSGNGVSAPLHRHAANREYRNRRRGGDCSQCSETGRTAARLRRALEDGAEDEVIDPSCLRGRNSIRNAVDGAADEKRRRNTRANAGRRERISAEMHAVGTGRERDVETIVDQDARRRAAYGVDTRRHEARQRAALEIALTDLYEVHAGVRRGTHALDEGRLPG